MPAVCPICCEILKNDANGIIGTTCGHVFHSNCWQQWRNRSEYCPHCRVAQPGTSKLFISFEEDTQLEERNKKQERELDNYARNIAAVQQQLDESKRQLNELRAENEAKLNTIKKLQEDLEKTKLDLGEEHIKNTSELQNELEETKRDLIALQSQLDEVEYVQMTSKLQNEYDRSQREFMALQEQSIKYVNEIRVLTEKCEYLSLQNREYERKNLQLGEDTNNMAQMRTTENVNVLEEKIKQLKKQLADEINASTELSIENMRYKSMLKQFNAAEMQQSTNLMNNYAVAAAAPPANNVNKAGVPLQTQVGIKGLDENDMKMSVPQFVIRLAALMGLSFVEADIVAFRKLNTKFPSIAVTFKDLNQRQLFLKKANALKSIAISKQYTIYEYSGRELSRLEHHARILVNCGYKKCFISNGSVWVQKNATAPLIEISNINEINRLKQEAQNAPTWRSA